MTLSVLSAEAISSGTATNSENFSLKSNQDYPKIVSVKIGASASSGEGDNFFTVRMYHSPDYNLVDLDSVNATWIEVPASVFNPVLLLVGETHSSDVGTWGSDSEYSISRQVHGNYPVCRLTVQRTDAGTNTVTVSAWVD